MEVRLSLQTASPKEARLRSAALAAGTAGVLELMEDNPFKDPTACPTMDELRQMARVAYGEILARLVQEQRSKPDRAAEFSLSNRTSADVYGYLHSNGGKREVTKVDEANLVAKGWDDVRIKRLREKLEDIDQGNYPISQRTLDFYLREKGYWPHNGLRQMVLAEFYPAYRDACRDAEAELQSSLNGTVGTDSSISLGAPPRRSADAYAHPRRAHRNLTTDAAVGHRPMAAFGDNENCGMNWWGGCPEFPSAMRQNSLKVDYRTRVALLFGRGLYTLCVQGQGPSAAMYLRAMDPDKWKRPDRCSSVPKKLLH